MDRGRSRDTAEREYAPVADASAALSLVLGMWRVFEGVHGLTVAVWTRNSWTHKRSVDLVVEEGPEPVDGGL